MPNLTFKSRTDYKLNVQLDFFNDLMYPTVRNIFLLQIPYTYVYLVETDKMMLIRLEFTYIRIKIACLAFFLGFLPDLDKRLNVFRQSIYIWTVSF